MSSNSTTKPVKSGLSLYANLLDPSSDGNAAPGTISGAPVSYKQAATEQKTAGAEKQQLSAASLRFQPTKRPQLQTQKAKPKPAAPKPTVSAPTNNGASPPIPDTATGATGPSQMKSTFADWTADADDAGFYGGEKRQRGGKKKRKKNTETRVVTQNWDDIYDPSRPNNYDDYKNSEEKIAEIREWKDRLYAHRYARDRSSESGSDSDYGYGRRMNNRFAPPPTFEDPPPPPPPPAQISESAPALAPDNATGEDAFERWKRLSQFANQPPPPPEDDASPPPPPTETAGSQQIEKKSISSGPAPSISRAPVRYNLPQAPAEIPATEADLESALNTEDAAMIDADQDQDQDLEPASADGSSRSLRPGQKGFAERLMSKYGWSKGSGLGAGGTGILNPLRVQVEKQKKKPDSEGGGFAGPGGMGKIIGGKRRGGGAAEEGKFGAMSEVIILRGMVDGMDLDAELDGGSGTGGGLMQEIGEECGEKYGRVERVFIDRETKHENDKIPVFVKFTSQLSALRAVNALEGRIFNGNTISARFFDTERFDRGDLV